MERENPFAVRVFPLFLLSISILRLSPHKFFEAPNHADVLAWLGMLNFQRYSAAPTAGMKIRLRRFFGIGEITHRAEGKEYGVCTRCDLTLVEK